MDSRACYVSQAREAEIRPKEEAKLPSSDRAAKTAKQYLQRFPDADQEIIKLFFRIDSTNEAMHAAGARVHDAVSPGSKRWLARVLRALYMAPDNRLSHAEIARRTGVPPTNVTYQIDALRDEGYVRRVPHESDRRVTLVELTAEGHALGELIIPAWTAFMSKLGESFSADEKRQLNSLLERLQVLAESSEV